MIYEPVIMISPLYSTAHALDLQDLIMERTVKFFHFHMFIDLSPVIILNSLQKIAKAKIWNYPPGRG